MSPAIWPVEWALDSRKITHYLLNEQHDAGGPKARFFLRFGFSARSPDRLAYELLSHPEYNTYVGEVVSRLGDMKYVFEGRIRAPDGRSPRIRTVWRIDANLTAHFVTAVPLKS